MVSALITTSTSTQDVQLPACSADCHASTAGAGSGGLGVRLPAQPEVTGRHPASTQSMLHIMMAGG